MIGFAAIVATQSAHGGMGNIGTTFGVMPSDIGTAQALSMFNDQVSATYYNPAYLVADERGELTAALLHAEQELRAASDQRDGDVLSDTPSQHVLIGMKTDIGSLTRFDHPIKLGFVAGVEKFGQEMLAFSSETSEEGQFLEYGRQPLFLNVGGATRIWRGINAGLAVRITLQAEAELNVSTNLGGETREEQLAVNAEPSLREILSLSMDFGETICPDESCFWDGFDAALAYRAKSATSTTIDSEVEVRPNLITDPPLELAVTTIDSFQPEIFVFGAQYRGDRWRLGGSIERQRWSELGREFKGDTIKNQEGVEDPGLLLDFESIWVPRIGAQYELTRNLDLRAGLAYEESPLASDASAEVNYFDNDRIVLGLGLSSRLCARSIFAYPIQLDFGYQYHHLRDRDFGVVPFDEDEPTETVTTDGDIHVFSGSLTFKF